MNSLAFLLGWMWGSSHAQPSSWLSEKWETRLIFATVAVGFLVFVAAVIGGIWLLCSIVW